MRHKECLVNRDLSIKKGSFSRNIFGLHSLERWVVESRIKNKKLSINNHKFGHCFKGALKGTGVVLPARFLAAEKARCRSV